MSETKKIAFITSNPLSAKVFLAPHMKALSKNYEITLISNFSDLEQSEFLSLGVTHIKHIPIVRNISLVYDTLSLLLLIKHFVVNRYCAVHSITPKAGLLGMLSAKIAFISARYHTFTGQVWVTQKGHFRTILKLMDKLIASCATDVLADSSSQSDFLLNERVVSSLPLVLANGSISGVDIERFAFKPSQRREIRDALNINERGIVFLFLGRLCVDKGIDELVSAFSDLVNCDPEVHLLLVGPNEQHYNDEYFNRLDIANIHRVDFTDSPQDYYCAGDVFVLPSYREGFGTSVLEAAATGLPAIASEIYGLTDAVEASKTGILVPTRDTAALLDAMKLLSTNGTLRNQLGFEAYVRASKLFSQDVVVHAMLEFYSDREKVKSA